MNQKSLSGVSLLVLVAASGSVTTSGSAVDVGSGYANVGRREARLRLTGFIGANTTALSASVVECDTTNGTYTAVTGTATITTSGAADAFVSIRKRYLKAVLTPAGTTASAQGHIDVFLENRSTTS